jgi:hypothetical protein
MHISFVLALGLGAMIASASVNVFSRSTYPRELLTGNLLSAYRAPIIVTSQRAPFPAFKMPTYTVATLSTSPVSATTMHSLTRRLSASITSAQILLI